MGTYARYALGLIVFVAGILQVIHAFKGPSAPAPPATESAPAVPTPEVPAAAPEAPAEPARAPATSAPEAIPTQTPEGVALLASKAPYPRFQTQPMGTVPYSLVVRFMRRLARLEHDRWCADRRLDGWSFGPNRDEARRLHPSLIAFDDPRFPDGEIAKDIGQIRFLFGAAAVSSPAGASAPIVLGVMKTSVPGVHGIDVSSAAALLDVDPWRPVIILSALLDDDECAALDTMSAMLRQAGRVFCLYVIDQGRARPADLSTHPILIDLLARAETRIVPIGYKGQSHADDWTDPTTASTQDAALAAYMVARAHAIVAPTLVTDPAPA